MNMYAWKDQMIATAKKKATPVLSFPSVQLMGITVRELISSSESQAKGMKMIADRQAEGFTLLLEAGIDGGTGFREAHRVGDEVIHRPLQPLPIHRTPKTLGKTLVGDRDAGHGCHGGGLFEGVQKLELQVLIVS